jgi:uncharacterized membrane protein YphA (DoxX/SURF4 family)
MIIGGNPLIPNSLPKKYVMAITSNYATHSTITASKSAIDRVTTILKFTYVLVPILAGADKFTHVLVNWDQYLAPQIADMLTFPAHTFMLIVGVIEIVAGLLVLIRPRLGSLIVCLWLLGIVINLLMGGQYYDVAVRDAVMAIGAFSLFTLSGRTRE